jgi:G:T/U-mismatch repair DNA glycosylase
MNDGAMKIAVAQTTQQAARHIAYTNLNAYELMQKASVAALQWGATPEEAVKLADETVKRLDAWWRERRDALETEFSTKEQGRCDSSE